MLDVLFRRPSTLVRHPLVLLALVVAMAVTLATPATAGWSNSNSASDRATQQWGATDTVETTQVGWSVRNYKRRITSETNDERARRDLVTVRWRTCLNRQAQRWAEYLARTGAFRHSNLQTAINRCNLRGVGENLALGYTNPSATIRAWMDSSGHRANILNRPHRLTGVGMARGSRGWVTVQLFGWQ